MLIQIIDVAIGLTLVFLLFSTVASSLVELIAVAFKRRSTLLLRGVQEIFGSTGVGDKEEEANKLAAAFYRLAPISSLYVGKVDTPASGSSRTMRS